MCNGRGMTDRVLIGSAQAAEMLGIDKSTLTRWVISGKLAAEKLPGALGAYVLDLADVEKLRDELTQATA
jgi:excisionase family DNA binding protein